MCVLDGDGWGEVFPQPSIMAVRNAGFEEIPSKHKTLQQFTPDGRFILLVEYPPLNGRHMANDKPNESL